MVEICKSIVSMGILCFYLVFPDVQIYISVLFAATQFLSTCTLLEPYASISFMILMVALSHLYMNKIGLV